MMIYFEEKKRKYKGEEVKNGWERLNFTVLGEKIPLLIKGGIGQKYPILGKYTPLTPLSKYYPRYNVAQLDKIPHFRPWLEKLNLNHNQKVSSRDVDPDPYHFDLPDPDPRRKIILKSRKFNHFLGNDLFTPLTWY